MPRTQKNASHRISTMNESPLHAALKKRYSRAYDRHEVLVDGFLIDIVRDDLLIEIQTANFSAIKRKLETLLKDHPVRLVYPVARERWIVRQSGDGDRLGRRRSPKHGSVESVFEELVYIPHLMPDPHFSLEVLLVEVDEIRRPNPRRRRKWVTHEQRLLEIIDRQLFQTPSDLRALIPAGLAEPFTNAELASAAGKPRWLAQKMTYGLSRMGALQQVGKRGNAHLFARIAEGA